VLTQVVQNCDIIFIAVKPQYVATVLAEIRPALKDTHIIVSIAAGITVERLLDAAGSDSRCIRVMPNTPCLVGETAAAMCLGGRVRASNVSITVVWGVGCGALVVSMRGWQLLPKCQPSQSSTWCLQPGRGTSWESATARVACAPACTAPSGPLLFPSCAVPLLLDRLCRCPRCCPQGGSHSSCSRSGGSTAAAAAVCVTCTEWGMPHCSMMIAPD
jgi:hypothetical protein